MYRLLRRVLFSACLLLIRADLQDVTIVELPTQIDSFESTSSAANAAGDVILVAWIADDLRAVALTQQALVASNFSQAQIITESQDSIALDGVSTFLNKVGSFGLITWLLYDTSTNTCVYQATQYNLSSATFSVPANISLTINSSLEACKRPSSGLLSNLRDSAWIVYPNTVMAGRLVLLYDTTNNSGWYLQQQLCCSSGYYIPAGQHQWSVAQSDAGDKAIIAWLRTSGTDLHLDLKEWEQEGGMTDGMVSFEIAGATDAQVDAAVNNDASRAIVAVTLTDRVLAYKHDNGTWEGPFPLYNTSAVQNTLVGVYVNLFGQDHVLVTFQLRQLGITNLIVCNTTLASMTCEDIKPVYVADSGTNNTQVIATGGNLYAIAYTLGTNTPSQTVKLHSGFYGNIAQDDITLDTNPSNASYCSLAVQSDVLPQQGTILTTWQSLQCADCRLCVEPTWHGKLALLTQSEGLYACNAQAQCVLASNGTFPDLGSCQDGCVPLPASGYLCNSKYQCIEVADNASFPSDQACSDACKPPIGYACKQGACVVVTSNPSFTSEHACERHCGQQASKHGLAAGGIVALVLFCGLLLPYLIGGMLYKRQVKGARGVEMLPHVQFWTRDFPSLVSDGVRFSTCRGVSKDSYQTI
eukprot:m.156126 g.156126  ORF g.156126 m.156126 type:complete len:640 (-) comp16430_c0_seq4:199-2118(-)